MANSAFTPNTNLSTDASATQSGVVNTTTQTFAGVKTFQDGAAIKGATSAPAAGYIGELKLDVANSSVTATYGNAAATVSSGSLTEGIWLIIAEVSGYNNVRPSSGIGCPDILIEVNSVQKSRLQAISQWYPSANIDDQYLFNGTVVAYAVVPSGSTHTVKVLLEATAMSGTPTNYTCTSRPSGRLRAIRIA